MTTPGEPDASQPPADSTGTPADAASVATTPGHPSKKARNRGFWALRDIPTLTWLVLAVVAVLVHRWLPTATATWLMIHLLLLGAVTHAILVWSQYFSFALLRTSPTVDDRRRQSIRLSLSNGGAALVVVGVLIPLWPVTIVGAAALVAAVIWHGASLWARSRGHLPGRFGKTLRYYIVAAAILPIGVALGAWLAGDHAAHTLVLAHAILNVLGWIGLTVAGTVVTLWPTILRTRADDRAVTAAARALPVMAIGVIVAAAGAAASVLPLVTLGLLAYVAGIVMIGVSIWTVARQEPPRTFAALSVALGLLWWLGSVLALAIAAIVSFWSGAGFDGLQDAADRIIPFLAAGFAAQVLVGALSYLVPVVIGGGPTPVRTGTAAFDRAGSARIAMANAALLVYALPVSSVMRVVASALYLIAMASFIPIMLVALRAQRVAKAAGARLTEHGHGPITPEGERPVGHRAGQAVAGLLAVVLAVAVTAAADPAAMGWTSTVATDQNAPVKIVKVDAANYRFTPNDIRIPSGTHLKIELTNADPSMVHDLVFSNGVNGNRLSPGQSEMIDVGVVTSNLDGWCSIVGHKQLGMTMTVTVSGSAAAAPTASASASPQASASDMPDMHDMSGMPGMDHGSSSGIDLSAAPGKDFTPYKAALAPLPPADGPVTRRVTLTVTDEIVEVAPGVTQRLWTYNGSTPGPVLHGRVGDTFVVTLRNNGDMGHSIDFHAGSLAPDKPMRTIAPGESLTYTFTAGRSGIWMYHCSTMPMTAHIANGMYGAVVIEPKEGLPAVDETYVLVQSEFYLGDHDGGEVDPDKVAEGRPDLVVFNGYANQYDHEQLPAKVGDRVRVWVLDAGVDRSTSFHVVGGQFDTVWTEGRYLIDRAKETGSQAMGLFPAQGGFVELTFPEAGHYPFVSHFMVDAERGAHGIFDVTK